MYIVLIGSKCFADAKTWIMCIKEKWRPNNVRASVEVCEYKLRYNSISNILRPQQ